MSAPTTAGKKRKKGRAPEGNPDLNTPASATAKSKPTLADLDFDRHIVESVNRDIWAAVFDGRFRLAVRCRRCGRWLTHGISKRNHLGPRCATKADKQ